MRKFKNGKVACKDEATREMINGGGERMVGWIWRVCNMVLRMVLCLKTGALL